MALLEEIEICRRLKIRKILCRCQTNAGWGKRVTWLVPANQLPGYTVSTVISRIDFSMTLDLQICFTGLGYVGGEIPDEIPAAQKIKIDAIPVGAVGRTEGTEGPTKLHEDIRVLIVTNTIVTSIRTVRKHSDAVAFINRFLLSRGTEIFTRPGLGLRSNPDRLERLPFQMMFPPAEATQILVAEMI